MGKYVIGIDAGTMGVRCVIFDLEGNEISSAYFETCLLYTSTLMFEPAQTALALQAKPYFINSFIRHRYMQSQAIRQFLELYKATGDKKFLEDLRAYMVEKDYFAAGEEKIDLFTVMAKARTIIDQRNLEQKEGSDGLDGIRHNLRLLRQTNLEDTRLIICSMEDVYKRQPFGRLGADLWGRCQKV